MPFARHAKLFTLLAMLAVFAMAVSGCGNDNGACPQTNGSGADLSPPSTPTGLTLVKITEDGMRLDWETSPDTDVVGYEIYYYDPNPVRDYAYVKLTSKPLTRSDFIFSDPQPDFNYYFKISAVTQSGLESESTQPYRVHWNGGPYESTHEDGSADRPPRGGGNPSPETPNDIPGNHPEDGESDPNTY